MDKKGPGNIKCNGYSQRAIYPLFKRNCKRIKKAVLESNRTKGTKFQSAMSMLNFYINRAGKNLDKEDKQRLEQAKDELRKLFKKSS